MSEERTFTAWVMTEQGEPCVESTLSLPPPPAGEAVIEVAGCGVCHTDISFLHMGVPTRHGPPLTLGHEISGTVIEVGEGVDTALLGEPVLVPAVLPCGECELCRAGYRRICRSQVMPGNDRHGGFASHVTVPARYLCPVGEDVLAKHELWEISVVADAITTPFQAVRLAGDGSISAEALLLAGELDEVPSFKEAKRAFETRYVVGLLRRCGGNISHAARLAKKDRKDFYDVIRRTGVNPSEFR